MDKHDDEPRLNARRRLLKAALVGAGFALPLMASFTKDGLRMSAAQASHKDSHSPGGKKKGGGKKK